MQEDKDIKMEKVIRCLCSIMVIISVLYSEDDGSIPVHGLQAK